MKNQKGSVSVVFCVILLIVVVVLGCTTYKFYTEKNEATQKAQKLETEVASLNSKVDSLQNTINKVSDVIGSTSENTSKESSSSNTVENNATVSENSENIIIYNGYEMEAKIGTQVPTDMKITEDAKQKYNTTYYNYEDGKYEGSTQGKFGDETYGGYSVVTNVKRVAMTKKYDAVPRIFARTTELPKELTDLEDFTSVAVDTIDLDNDGKEEKIVCYTISYKEGEIGNGEPKAFSKIMLFDSNYKKVSDLVVLEDGFWAGIKEEDKKVFLSLEDVEYIDIDEDGIMEIIIQVPMYEGFKLDVLKYDNGTLSGEKELKASVLP